MPTLHLFFEQNAPIIHFAYGLAFFIMGLAIALQSRQTSRLELARSLVWLAAFGITHSLYEWGELFSPVHESYLTPEGSFILHDVHLVFLSVSFVFLLEFGVALLRPLQRGQWLHPVTIIVFVGYVVFVLLILPRFIPDPFIWHNTADALARYTMGFPGGLLAAYGLREQTFRHIAPLKAPHIVSTLRMAGIALALYAVLGGLIPPPILFFPGSVINTETFEQLVGIPTLVFQSLIGLVLSITIIRALEVFQVETERRIEQIEQQQILAAERERMARELHDRTIQTAYTAGLMVDSARKLAEPDSQLYTRLDHAVTALDEVIQDLRRSLGELRSPPSGETLSVILRRMAEDPRFRSLVNIDLDLSLPQAETLSPARADQVLAIVGEALANVIRHAHATQVSIQARQVDGRLEMIVQDNGSGLPHQLEPGFGMRNMTDRARLLGGQLQVSSERGKGTTIHLDIPWEEDGS
jgi:signal transduction histidine kinase